MELCNDHNGGRGKGVNHSMEMGGGYLKMREINTLCTLCTSVHFPYTFAQTSSPKFVSKIKRLKRINNFYPPRIINFGKIKVNLIRSKLKRNFGDDPISIF